MDGSFVGGFRMPEPGSPFTSGPPPTPPPKDNAGHYHPGNGHRPPSFGTVPPQASQYEGIPEPLSPLHALARMSAVERSRNLKVLHMEPYLQVMAGPLLRYDTVDKQGVWRGAALVVSKSS